MRLGPVRLAVVLLGDRLSGAVVQQHRVDTFVIDSEPPAAASRAKLRPVWITVAAHDLLALVKTARRQHVAWLHRCGDTADVLLLDGPTLVLSRSVRATDAAEVAAEALRSFTVARWRACDAIWVSGDQADALTAALLPLGAPVTRPPYTPRAERRLDRKS